MASKATIEQFDGGDFSQYRERLEFYFCANGIGEIASNASNSERLKEEKKMTAHLVSLRSKTVYSTLKTLSSYISVGLQVRPNCDISSGPLQDEDIPYHSHASFPTVHPKFYRSCHWVLPSFEEHCCGLSVWHSLGSCIIWSVCGWAMRLLRSKINLVQDGHRCFYLRRRDLWGSRLAPQGNFIWTTVKLE